MKVTRVADQDAGFLRFVEAQELKPGRSIQVEARDPVADCVLVRTGGKRRITIGTKAAAKLLIEVL